MRRTAAHLNVSGRPDWTFAIATPEDIGRVMRAAGFWFTWDAAREQFDHPAMLVAIRDGSIVRLLVGGTVTALRLAELLQEARDNSSRAIPCLGTCDSVASSTTRRRAPRHRAGERCCSLSRPPSRRAGLCCSSAASAGAARRKSLNQTATRQASRPIHA
jgi:hypothetical protein